MAIYKIDVETAHDGGVLLRVGFGDPAQGDAIAAEAERLMKALDESGRLTGSLARINGPASLAVAVVLSHWLSHRFATVAVYDPKLGKYIVACSHGGPAVGTLID